MFEWLCNLEWSVCESCATSDRKGLLCWSLNVTLHVKSMSKYARRSTVMWRMTPNKKYWRQFLLYCISIMFKLTYLHIHFFFSFFFTRLEAWLLLHFLPVVLKWGAVINQRCVQQLLVLPLIIRAACCCDSHHMQLPFQVQDAVRLKPHFESVFHKLVPLLLSTYMCFSRLTWIILHPLIPQLPLSFLP